MTKPFKMVFRLALLAVLTCLSVSFSVGNQQQISLSLPPSSVAVNMPVYLFGGMAFTIGLTFGVLSTLIYHYRTISRLQRGFRASQKELSALRQQTRAEQVEAFGHARLVQQYGISAHQ